MVGPFQVSCSRPASSAIRFVRRRCVLQDCADRCVQFPGDRTGESAPERGPKTLPCAFVFLETSFDYSLRARGVLRRNVLKQFILPST